MIRVIGYIRVSTDKQDLQRQKELIVRRTAKRTIISWCVSSVRK